MLVQLTGLYSDFTGYIYRLSFVYVCVCVCVCRYAILLQGWWLHISNPTIKIFICTIATNLSQVIPSVSHPALPISPKLW